MNTTVFKRIKYESIKIICLTFSSIPDPASNNLASPVLSNTKKWNNALKAQMYNCIKTIDGLTYMASIELTVVIKLWLGNVKYIERIEFDTIPGQLSAGIRIFCLINMYYSTFQSLSIQTFIQAPTIRRQPISMKINRKSYLISDP